MVAGIPGTGIGGLFYILLAFLMPIQEAGRLIQGRSSVRRWGNVSLQVANAAGILASVWLTGWFIGKLIHRVQAAGMTAVHLPNEQSFVISLAGACTALVALGLVVLGVNLLGLVVPARKRPVMPGANISQ